MISSLLDSDFLVATLWTIYERVKADRRQAQVGTLPTFQTNLSRLLLILVP